jgi:hypothetical protein
LAALTYNKSDDDEDGQLLEFETPSSTSSIASSARKPFYLSQDDDWQENAKRAGMALQRTINEGPISHYRRMEKAAQEEYAFDMINEFMDDQKSRCSSVASSFDSVTTTQAVELTASCMTRRPSEQHIIPLPVTPLLDLDDHEAELQRQRQEAIEREIAELDVSLRRELEAFDAHNDLLKIRSSRLFDGDADSCFESELICGPKSPLIEYEAPVGWRRGGPKVFSTNFLGLQLNTNLTPPDCADEEEDKARIQRLHQALDQSFGELTTSMAMEDGLQMSRVPLHPLTKLQTSNVQFINPFCSPHPSNAISMSRSSSNGSSDRTLCDAEPISPTSFATATMRVPDRKSSLPLLTAPHLFVSPDEKIPLSPRGRLINFPSKQNLANFFHRRPSQSTLMMNQTGIGSADLALTPHQIRSAPPRYIPLPRSLRS